MQVNQIHELKQLIDKKNDFLILVHTKPDGDALGSAYALSLYLQSQGKKAVVGLEEDIFEKYKNFIDDKDYQEYFLRYKDIKEKSFQTIVVLDCSTYKLLGLYKEMVENNKDKVIVIDHHLTPEDISDTQYINSEASSTCEIIFDLLEGKMLNAKMAQAIYMGIVFDTGQFRHASTTASVFHKIARILEQYPVNLESVYYFLFENETLVRKKVIAKLIDTITLFAEGRIAVGYLDLKTIKALKDQGINPIENELSDLIVVPHSIRDVQVSVLVREKYDQITFSFRSRCNFNVADVAAHFGGGGHKKAAGLKIESMSIKKVNETVIQYLVEEFVQWQNGS
jgi:phosphoesterase RecJ-like protein